MVRKGKVQGEMGWGIEDKLGRYSGVGLGIWDLFSLVARKGFEGRRPIL